jgi:hypothetical protein
MDKKETTPIQDPASFSSEPPTKVPELDTDVEAEAAKMGTNPGEWASKEGA